MAARYPHAQAVATMQNPRHVSITELERDLEELTQQVAERKRQLSDTFKQIHQKVEQREVALLAELDAIPGEIRARIHDRRVILEKLEHIRDDTEKELNILNTLLRRNLNNIEEAMEETLSEQISFPLVSISCQMEEIEKTLEEKCHVMKLHYSYGCRTLPIWYGVKEGREKDQLDVPTAICIDPPSQLIYVGDSSTSARIQVFTSEGNHYLTLRNPLTSNCQYMKIHNDHLYMMTHSSPPLFLKLSKKGKTIKQVKLDTPMCGISIEESNIYTCVRKSLTVQIFDLDLKYTKKIVLKAISFISEATTPRDITRHKQQMFILFSYCGIHNNNHPDPIQVFELDGTLTRSLVTGNDIKDARYFCLDSYENILVNDCRGHCIIIFSPDGILMQKIGREGKKEAGEFYYPSGIAVDSKQRIIIVDEKEDNKLQAF